MLVIGLTGGIGCGKTTVSRHFESLGVPVIDADIVARELVEPGTPQLQEIARIFGSDILTSTGELNRDTMRERVFNNPEARDELEKILR